MIGIFLIRKLSDHLRKIRNMLTRKKGRVVEQFRRNVDVVSVD